MKIKYLSKVEAEKLMTENDLSSLVKLNDNQGEFYKKLRLDILKMSNTILVENFRYNGNVDFVISKKAEYDLLFGLQLYEYITNELRVEMKDISNIEFWIYLSVLVVPDIISMRWDYSAFARFFSVNNRIYLSTIWWYIHLSWQGSVDKTKEILIGNTTDEILNLVDRTSVDGYRVDLYREIMKEFSKIDNIKIKGKDRSMFRKIMTLNVSLLPTIEPTLMEGGNEAYVKYLFNYLGLEKIDGKYKQKIKESE